jgi:hypothetical protein
MKKYRGSCHCKTIQFEVEVDQPLTVHECNCSICSKSGYLHIIVSQSKFHLLKGQKNLATYLFNTGIAKHMFCKTCGIKSFYIPRSNPDGVDVNARCLDKLDMETVIDGKHWEKHSDELRHLSKD